MAHGLSAGTRNSASHWEAHGLPEHVSFGQAVGVFVLAMAMRDGASVDGAEARRVVTEVAERCAQGVPQGDFFVSIDFTTTDVAGFARAIARGHF